MYRERTVTLFVGLLFCAGAMADDCERFKLHGVHLGDTAEEIRAVRGKPYRSKRYTPTKGQWVTREEFIVGSTEMIVMSDGADAPMRFGGGRELHRGGVTSLEFRVPHTAVPYQGVMDAMVESFGPPTWSKIEPEPKFDQSVMTWESDACDIYVTVFHKRTKSYAFRGDSLVVQMRTLASNRTATEAFK